jgi:cbb3-type cytochrome oxidase maturation protein
LAIGFLSAFIWSVKSGQMDDDYTPSVRILFDDPPQQDKTPDNTSLPKT